MFVSLNVLRFEAVNFCTDCTEIAAVGIVRLICGGLIAPQTRKHVLCVEVVPHIVSFSHGHLVNLQSLGPPADVVLFVCHAA